MTPSYKAYLENLIGRLYGVMCEREKNGQWEKFLTSISVEIIGLETEDSPLWYWKLRAKLCALHLFEWKTFRRTILECTNILSRVLDNEDKANVL